jgi:hypothetical protein
MAALFPKIYDIIEQNPHKDTILRWREPTATEDFFTEVWEGFHAKPMDPPGALSTILFHTEPMFELSTLALRKQLLTEALLKLHERVDKELIGRRYPRKKIQDLLALELTAQTPSPHVILEDALCELAQIQKLRLNRQAKTIQVSPPDFRLWTTTKRLVFAEQDNRWTFHPVESELLAEWLLTKEQQGWSIPWPTADGKLDDLKQMCNELGLSMDTKQKKDDLAIKVGKAQALRHLRNLSLKTC